ncbi:MAG: ArsR family transcriptional regulator [Actinobacteria bacterium]|jgi:DNA-binding transcriptional ArsR family regulator|nr:MAG: ArsR family transcriptional regulator [Actinomycetota bacterium]
MSGAEASEMFKALAVETRVRILDILKSRGPMGAKGIADIIGITPAAVSQHLRILKQAGLVRSERQGYWIPYSINEEALEECRKLLNDVCTCGCGCVDAVGFRDKGLQGATLKELKDYERELREELEAARERIAELERR